MSNYICLFNNSFTPLGKWSQHLAKSWSLTRKANEPDEFNCVCKDWENSKSACFVGLYSQEGKLLYVSFCGIPSTKDGLTSVTGIDCRKIYDQEIIVDYAATTSAGDYKILTVQSLFTFLLYTALSDYGVKLSIDFTIDVSAASDVTWVETYITRTSDTRNIFTEITKFCSLYNLIVLTDVEIDSNENTYKLVFKLQKIYQTKNIKLSDYDVVMKQNQGIVNSVVCLGKNDSGKSFLYLYNDNTMSPNYDSSKCLFPPKTSLIEEDTLAEAVASGYAELGKNRYKDKVTINLNTKLGSTLESLDLTYFGNITGYNPADTNTVKTLPVSSIKTDSDGNRTLTFGRLSDYWFMEE